MLPQTVICEPSPQLLTYHLNKAIRNKMRVIPESIIIGPYVSEEKGQPCMAIVFPGPELDGAISREDEVEAVNRINAERLKAESDARIQEMRNEAENLWWGNDALGINGMTAKGAGEAREMRIQHAVAKVIGMLSERNFSELDAEEVFRRLSAKR